MLTHFDRALIEPIREYAASHQALELAARHIMDSLAFKGSVILGLLWYCWTGKDGRVDPRSARIIAGGLLAITIGRLLQTQLPFRSRPDIDPAFAALYQTETARKVAVKWGLHDWSSMPSDHAIMYFALATGIFFLNRRWGLFALAWTAIFICLPRVVMGLHYPSDVLVGSVIGIATMTVTMRVKVPDRLDRALIAAYTRQPRAVYALLFVLSIQLATQFESIRRAAEKLAKLV